MTNAWKNIIQPKFRSLLIRFFRSGALNFVPDQLFVRWLYRVRMGSPLDLNHLKTYYHKINWLKYSYRDPLLKVCADKYTVRNYIESKVGNQVLVPLLGVYKDASEIDFDGLPAQFVIKSSGGSGGNIICKNKADLNLPEVRRKLNAWIQQNYYWRGREWCYKDNQSVILCEKYMTNNGEVPRDYKVYCFHGAPEYIVVFHDRFSGSPSQTVYNKNWEVVPGLMDVHFALNQKNIEPSPSCFAEMISIATQLSHDFIHVRVDFYIIHGELKVGELTFFNASGCTRMDPPELDQQIGDLLDLNKISNDGLYRTPVEGLKQ